MLVTQPCLLCDAPVEVDKEEWEAEEEAFVLCDSCDPYVDQGVIPWPQIQMIYVLRCQVANLYSKVQVAEQHITRLYAAQKEFEQEVLSLRKLVRA